MEVLITSKTHVGNSACVGGIVLETLQFVRLLNGKNTYQPGDTELEIGQIWEIDFASHPDVAPHVEDVYVINKKFIRTLADVRAFVVKNLNVWEGKPEILFDGLLKWTGNGSGFLDNPNNLPQNSVGFWISDRDLILEDNRYFVYKRKRIWKSRKFSYVGFPDRISVIPAGTLIRVSLAKWWKPEDIAIGHRCYLQLSGWY
ncbi:dual OB domain-containing protein [Yeosuana marina]|uniref:dual OB domain-containing protein n=1 Tax=Yeosuana marina TaxID=1565536 RepID=UPI0014238084|nr:hypothetical protein [Yeosuana marina]